MNLFLQRRFAPAIRLPYSPMDRRSRKDRNSGRCEEARVAHIHRVSHGIDCKRMGAKVRSYALDNFVLVSGDLSDDCQIPGRTRRIDSMEGGIERYAVGPPTDFQGRYNLMFFQVKYHQLGI